MVETEQVVPAIVVVESKTSVTGRCGGERRISNIDVLCK